jgi:hypothetical protein
MMQTPPLTSRRAVLAGLAATARSLLLHPSGPASAAGMMPMRAIRRFGLGGMAITVIDDGSFTMPASMFASNAPKGEIGRLLESYGLPARTAEIPLQVMLVALNCHFMPSHTLPIHA